VINSQLLTHARKISEWVGIRDGRSLPLHPSGHACEPPCVPFILMPVLDCRPCVTPPARLLPAAEAASTAAPRPPSTFARCRQRCLDNPATVKLGHRLPYHLRWLSDRHVTPLAPPPPSSSALSSRLRLAALSDATAPRHLNQTRFYTRSKKGTGPARPLAEEGGRVAGPPRPVTSRYIDFSFLNIGVYERKEKPVDRFFG
jgi:hypothetical protein